MRGKKATDIIIYKTDVLQLSKFLSFEISKKIIFYLIKTLE